MFKRMMSLLLALVLVAGLLPPVQIHAEEAEEIPETAAVETVAAETEETETAAAETTVPAETEAATEAEETAPAETEPLQTEAEETEPEELEADGIVSSAATLHPLRAKGAPRLLCRVNEVMDEIMPRIRPVEGP